MKIIVVDDTLLFRKLVSDVISTDSDCEVIKRCRNGAVALEAIKELKPDLITLDLDMPVMNGLELLDNLNKEGIEIGVIVISAHTVTGGLQTIEALGKGAFDFITKPSESSEEANINLLKNILLPRIKSWKKSLSLKNNKIKTEIKPDIPQELDYIPEIAAIGVSTGGPEALRKIIPRLPGDFKLPILIVQHMPPIFTSSLANILNQHSNLTVKEATDREKVLKGHVYIAPGGKQMKVEKVNNTLLIKITDDPAEQNCKPSVNYLFRSLANTMPGKVLALILTGMGNDGALGVKLLKRHKCYTIVQNETSSVVFGMPRAIINQGSANRVLSLREIVDFLLELNIKWKK